MDIQVQLAHDEIEIGEIEVTYNSDFTLSIGPFLIELSGDHAEALYKKLHEYFGPIDEEPEAKPKRSSRRQPELKGESK